MLCLTASLIAKKISYVLLQTSLQRKYAVCYCQLHCEGDMLCVTTSLIGKEIWCVLLPASLWRRYAVSYCQRHCEEDIFLCSFINVPPVPSPESRGFVWVGHASNKVYFKCMKGHGQNYLCIVNCSDNIFKKTKNNKQTKKSTSALLRKKKHTTSQPHSCKFVRFYTREHLLNNRFLVPTYKNCRFLFVFFFFFLGGGFF